jgi:predicted enzyme related to lactoylglutathione lyase
MLNFNSIMLNTGNVKVLADFYEQVFGKKPDMQDGGYYGWQVGNSFFTVGEHSEVSGTTKESNRILFNFETTKVKEEFERISKIDGVNVVKKPYGMTEEGETTSDEGPFLIATFADPDGNYFQLMSPWDDGSN